MKRTLFAVLLVCLLVGTMPAGIQAGTPEPGAKFAGAGYTALKASKRFTWQNPLPQGNSLNDVDFVDPNTGWAVGDNGTVIKTIDGGVSWQQQGPIVPQGENAVDAGTWDVCFVDADHGWVGADGTVYRTTDGGATWTQTAAWAMLPPATAVYIPYLSIDFNDVGNGWFVGGYNVWRTTNGGDTVTKASLPATASPTLVVAADSTTAYMNDLDEGYFKTVDGSTWERDHFDGTAAAAAAADSFAAVHAQKVYAAAGGEVYLTTNGGSTWTTMTVEHDAWDPIRKVYISEGDLTGATAYAVTEGNKLYKTTDSGTTTWTLSATFQAFEDLDVPSATSLYAIDASRIKASSGGAFSPLCAGPTDALVAVDFTSDTTGHAVGDYGYMRTTDGGQSWGRTDLTPYNIFANNLFFLESSPTVGWIVGSSAGDGPSAIKTTDGGETWASVTETDLVATGLHFVDAENGWAFGDSKNELWKTTDGGNDWVRLSGEWGGWFRDIDFTDANNGWLAIDDSSGYVKVIHTANAGATWTTQTILPATGGSATEIDFVDANNGYVIDSFDNLYKTANGGTNWTKVTLSPYAITFDIYDIKFTTKDDGWLVGRQKTSNYAAAHRHGFAAHTTDGGLTWDYKDDAANSDGGSTGAAGSIQAVDSVAGGDTWIVGGGGAILKASGPSAITLTSASKSLSTYGAAYSLTGILRNNKGFYLPYEPVVLQVSSTGSGFSDSSVVATTAVDGTFSISLTPVSTTYYRVRYLGDDQRAAAPPSSSVRVIPAPYVYNPVAPTVMYRNRAVNIYAFIKPRHTAGSSPVRLYRYRYVNGAYRQYGTYLTMKAYNYNSTTSKCIRSVSLPYAGRWRLRTYHPADAGQSAKWSSGYDYVTVR